MPKCENCLHKKDCIDGANFKNAENCERFALSDSAIIKALECCMNAECKNCPCFVEEVQSCKDLPIFDIVVLINRQLAEIKALQNQNQILSDNADTAYQDGLNEMRELVKPEIIKEFAENLKAGMRDLARLDYGGNTFFLVGTAFVDNLVKEMG